MSAWDIAGTVCDIEASVWSVAGAMWVVPGARWAFTCAMKETEFVMWSVSGTI